ncbi:hypothetical protein DL96DRAFT_1110178 [Flagelloscypha sp. PMI_526]|nr:hypothetical protein DL96DRAFT_1110178 [Flagelloscypha sp. PMI_526]
MATFGGAAGRLKSKALPSPPSTGPHYDADEEFDKEQQPNLARTLNDAFNANYDANDDVLQPSNHIFLGTTVAKKAPSSTTNLTLPMSPVSPPNNAQPSPLSFGDHQSSKLSSNHQVSRHSVSIFSRLSIEPHRSSYSNGSEPRELRTVLTSQGEAETVAPITKYPVPNDLTTPKRQQSQSIPAQLYQTPASSSSHVPNAVPTTTATTKKKERSLFTDSESNGQDSEVEIVKISPAKAPKFVKTKYRRMTRQRKRASPSPSDVDSESDPEKHVSSSPSRRSRKKIDSENENGESNESVKFIGSFGAQKRRRPPPDSPPRQYPSRSRPKAPLASNDLTISTGSKRPTSLIVELTPLSPSKKAQYPRYFSQNDPELGRLMGRLVSVRQHYADKGEHLADHSGGLPDLVDGTYWHPAESSRGTTEKLPRRRGRPPKRPDADFDNSGSSRPLKRSRMSKPKNPPRTVTTTTTAHARSSAKSRKQPNPTAQPTDNPMNEMFWVHHFDSETLSTVNLLSVHDQQRRPIVPTLRSLGDLSSGIAVTESEINGLDVHEWIWMSSPPKPCRMVLVTLDELTAEEDENVQSWMHVPTHEQEQVELVVGTEWQCQNVLLAAAEELEDIRLNDEVTRQNQEIDTTAVFVHFDAGFSARPGRAPRLGRNSSPRRGNRQS